MKLAIIFMVFIAAASAAYMTTEQKFADDVYVKRQMTIFEILKNVWQPVIHNSYYEESKDFDYTTVKDQITNEDAFKCFDESFHIGFLHRDENYSPFNPMHNYQMLALFKMLYYAKDWDTFYKIAVWARFYINPGMFIQSFSMAVLHRKDFEGYILPPIFEISPFYFFNSYVITKARLVEMQGLSAMTKDGDTYTYTIPMNYTNYYVNTNHEAKLAYFTEDIGLNSYYYYWNMDYYASLGGDQFGLNKDRRGEFYIYQLRQLLARYYLERLSNGMGEIPELNLWGGVDTGYDPLLMFYNGVNFPTRTNYYMMHLNSDNARYLDHYYALERRIFDAIDSGYFLKPDGEKLKIDDPKTVEYLGNIIQRNKDSMGNMYFYGMLETLGRKLLSGSFDSVMSFKRFPSVLELFETSMRDPMFYVFFKRISVFYDAFVMKMPKYKFDDLNFDGVKIESVNIDKLMTYFDYYYASIGNAIDIPLETKEKADLTKLYRVQVPRLSHSPFTVSIKVKSTKAQKGVVTMFVGPKYDSFGNKIDYNANRNNFWELDRWEVDLQEGDNDIVRKSTDFSWFAGETTSSFQLYKELMIASNGGDKFIMDQREAHCGFPGRLMLPRGRVGGFPVQFFFMVYPYTAPEVPQFTGYDKVVSCGVGSGARYLDDKPFGYPLDRFKVYSMKFTPNMFTYDTFVYHKVNNEIMHVF